MHELGIATSILDAVRTEIASRAGARPLKVAVRVGEMAGVDPASLSFCFEVLAKERDWGGLALEIQPTPDDELEISYLEVEEA
jgi:hydrogenase nickel incorporation protein HypA/HybF